MLLRHKPEDILGMHSNWLLSANLRKIKKVLKIKFHRQFIEFCEKHDLAFVITELAITHLDFDKSFLDILLKGGFDKETVDYLKKQPSAKILVDAELKTASHLLIFKKRLLEGNKFLQIN